MGEHGAVHTWGPSREELRMSRIMLTFVILSGLVMFKGSSCFAKSVRPVNRKQLSGGVAESVELIKSKLTEKGFNIFTTVDHAKNAAGVNLELRPTTVIIFGNPKVGTKLMQCAQEYAIDLPQKVLVYEDADGKVWAVVNNQMALADRHGAMGCAALVEKVNGVLSTILESF